MLLDHGETASSQVGQISKLDATDSMGLRNVDNGLLWSGQV